MRQLPVAVATVGLLGCAPQIATTPAPGDGPSLIPKGTAVAVQPRNKPEPVLGTVVHIDERRAVVYVPIGAGRVEVFQRDDVLALYRRPGSHLGMGWLLGAGVGGVAGWALGGKGCDRLSGCRDSSYRGPTNDEKIMTWGGAVAGALILSAFGHMMDSTARGTNPSDWVRIKWPGHAEARDRDND